jgi:hypothetical protein
MKAKKPLLNPLRTLLDLRHWIRRNARHHDGKPWTPKRVNDALLWWHALQEAETGGWSELRNKDIANTLLTGLKPLALSDVQEALDDAWVNSLEPGEEPDIYRINIEAQLKEHFRGNLV